MKKLLAASAIAAAGLAATGVSFAAAAPAPMMGVANPWYVGIGVNYPATMTDKIQDSDGDQLKLNTRGVGGNIFVGYRVNNYFGTELGLSMLGTDKYKFTAADGTSTNNALKLQDQWNVHFVGNAYLPVTDWFEPYAFAGVGYISSEARVGNNSLIKETDNGFGLIYGAGLQFNINQFGIRVNYTR